MPLGIGSPLPSGIPGFNQAGMYIAAGVGGGSVNAKPLPSWYNVIRSVITANDSVSLPPATCGGEAIMVQNVGAANLMVFGARNGAVEDTIDDGTGTQATTGMIVPVGTAMLFYAITPQGGYTNAPTPGAWIGRAFA
jgi:hypothetical protein